MRLSWNICSQRWMPWYPLPILHCLLVSTPGLPLFHLPNIDEILVTLHVTLTIHNTCFVVYESYTTKHRECWCTNRTVHLNLYIEVLHRLVWLVQQDISFLDDAKSSSFHLICHFTLSHFISSNCHMPPLGLVNPHLNVQITDDSNKMLQK